MKLGLHIGYWGLGLTAPQQLELVLEAERLGYDSVWTAEAYGSDAATILAWLAQATTTIKLGSAIFQMPGRSAAMTAMTAATIDQLSDGRMLLGIGSSGPQVAEGWHGQRFARQLQRTREYVAVVRDGAAPRARGLRRRDAAAAAARRAGQGAEAARSPPSRSGSRSTSPRSGRRTRRWRPRSPTAGCRRSSRPSTSASSGRCCEEGFARAGGGKGFDDFDIVPTVTAMVSDDRESARDAMRHYVALYVGGMGSRKQNFYNALVRRYGFEDAARDRPGPVPGGPQGRGRRRAAGRADRHAVPGRPARLRPRAARGLPRGGRRDADDLADGVDVRGAARAAARGRRAGGVNLRPLTRGATSDALTELARVCDETYLEWAPPGWTVPVAPPHWADRYLERRRLGLLGLGRPAARRLGRVPARDSSDGRARRARVRASVALAPGHRAAR